MKNITSFSDGKDSTAMLLKLIEKKIRINKNLFKLLMSSTYGRLGMKKFPRKKIPHLTPNEFKKI